MQKIDAHQHFWQYHPVKDAWISDDMPAIKHNFYPEDLQPHLQANGITGSVAVQAAQTEAETLFLADLADKNPFIKGVVGWVDLQAEDLEDRLQYFRQYAIIKGFRHILQAEAGEFMLAKPFLRGIGLLQQYDFTYDILINRTQLSFATEMAGQFPQQRFVIDHFAKPAIKAGEITAWQRGIKAIAQCPNVLCKVSGFGTEADWDNWTVEDVKPYFDVVFDVFGIDRVMFGSDWPVSLLAGGYNKSVQCLEAYMAHYNVDDQARFWGGNAVDFYRL